MYSAIEFVNNFRPYDYVGMVSFDYTAHNDYAPSTNFKASGSHRSRGCHRQYRLRQQHQHNRRPGTRLPPNPDHKYPAGANVIVLFTDGVPME